MIAIVCNSFVTTVSLVKSSAKDLIKENTFRLNIGFTFNEEWFRKWRMK